MSCMYSIVLRLKGCKPVSIITSMLKECNISILQLCLAVADLALQMATWKEAAKDLIERYYRFDCILVLKSLQIYFQCLGLSKCV